MDFVRLVLTLFGLSGKYKSVDQFLSGLFISIMSILCFLLLLAIPVFNYSVSMLITKITSFMITLSLVLAYLLLKKRIGKFYGIYDENTAFNCKITRKQTKSNLSIFMFSICFT